MTDAASVVCSNVVLDEHGVLMVRESKPAALGRWSLPAGRLERGESLRECAAREALEETGLVVEVGSLLGIYHCPATLEGGAAVQFVFRSSVSGGEMRTSAEHPEVAFVTFSAFDRLVAHHQVRGSHVAAAVGTARAGVALADVVTEVVASPPPTTPAVDLDPFT